MINSCCYSHNSNLKSATKSKEKKKPLQNAMQCKLVQVLQSWLQQEQQQQLIRV
jgi:hypothetical protein